MPLVAPAPVVLSTVQADTFEILTFKPDARTGMVEIEWRGGTKQPDGTVVWSSGGVQAVKYAPYALVPPNSRAYPTLYAQVKAQLYLAMQDASIFPAGNLS